MDFVKAYNDKGAHDYYILVDIADISSNTTKKGKKYNSDGRKNFKAVKMLILPKYALELNNASNVGYNVTLGDTGESGIRFNLTKGIKDALIKDGIIIGTTVEWQNFDKKKFTNKGYFAEWLVYRYFGIENMWKKDNSPFWEKADLEIDGIRYQIKTNQGIMATCSQLGFEEWKVGE